MRALALIGERNKMTDERHKCMTQRITELFYFGCIEQDSLVGILNQWAESVALAVIAW
jgi:hypothetical protein